MTTLDTRLRATAETLIAKYGKAMTLRREAVGAYDPSTGAATETPTDYAIKAVVAEPSVALFQAGIALAGDVTLLVAAKALDIIPVPGDEIVFDGTVYKAVKAAAIYSGEQVAAYDVLARS